MRPKTLFIIAGPNGAGKTTASYNMLPELLDCKEFVNADEIAKGLSPFQPDQVAFEAGRIMLMRMDELISRGETFAFETTLSTKTHANRIQKAKDLGYNVGLIFFWLQSPEIAKQRVAERVRLGGHFIDEQTIYRRYKRGLINLNEIYLRLCDTVVLLDNSGDIPKVIYEKSLETQTIVQKDIWEIINNTRL